MKKPQGKNQHSAAADIDILKATRLLLLCHAVQSDCFSHLFGV